MGSTSGFGVIHDRFSGDIIGISPTDNFSQRTEATQTNIFLIQATIPDTRRDDWHFYIVIHFDGVRTII
jgi:hypothetical protein